MTATVYPPIGPISALETLSVLNVQALSAAADAVNVLQNTGVPLGSVLPTNALTQSTLSDFAARTVYVEDFGALGNAVLSGTTLTATDDGPAVNAAVASFGGRPGKVRFRSKNYCIRTPIVVVNPAVQFEGEGYNEGPGPLAGTWLMSDVTTPGFHIFLLGGPNIQPNGVRGTSIRRMAFAQPQPAPSANPGVAWTPITYDYLISVQGVGGEVVLDDLFFCGVYNWIDIFDAGHWKIGRIYGQAYSNGVRVRSCFDTPYIDSIRHWGYVDSNPNKLAWTQANTDVLILGRCDGIVLGDIFGICARSVVRCIYEAATTITGSCSGTTLTVSALSGLPIAVGSAIWQGNTNLGTVQTVALNGLSCTLTTGGTYPAGTTFTVPIGNAEGIIDALEGDHCQYGLWLDTEEAPPNTQPIPWQIANINCNANKYDDSQALPGGFAIYSTFAGYSTIQIGTAWFYRMSGAAVLLAGDSGVLQIGVMNAEQCVLSSQPGCPIIDVGDTSTVTHPSVPNRADVSLVNITNSGSTIVASSGKGASTSRTYDGTGNGQFYWGHAVVAGQAVGSSVPAVKLPTISKSARPPTAADTGYSVPGNWPDSTHGVLWNCLHNTVPAAWMATSALLPADQAPGLVAAYGITRVLALYGTGPAFDVVANSTTTTIPFLPNGLPNYALMDAVTQGVIPRVSQWYDQSGNGRHLTQSNFAQMPAISPASTIGGARSLVFDTVMRGDVAFSGSISGAMLTTTGSPALAAGMTISGPAGVFPGTLITGGSGNTWAVTPSQTVNSGSMIANYRRFMVIPPGVSLNSNGAGIMATVRLTTTQLNQAIVQLTGPAAGQAMLLEEWDTGQSSVFLDVTGGAIVGQTPSNLGPSTTPQVLCATNNGAYYSISCNDTVVQSAENGASGVTLTGGFVGMGEGAGPGATSAEFAFAQFELGALIISGAYQSIPAILAGASAHYIVGQMAPQILDAWIADGDSRTEGYGATLLQGYVRQAEAMLTRPVVIHDVATFGDTMVNRNTIFGATVAPLYNAAAAVQVISNAAGINDLDGGTSAATIYASATAWVAKAKALGGNVVAVLATVPPSANPAAAVETQRLAYNASVRSGAVAGGYLVVDLAADPTVGSASIMAQGQFSADGLHWTALMSSFVAQTFATALNSVLA